MDKSSALIGTLLLVLCAIPFIVIYIKRRSKEKELLADVFSVSSLQNFSLGEHEFCREFIIGKGKDEEFVFFSKKGTKEATTSVLPFTDIQNCKMEKITKSVEDATGSRTIVEKVELHLQLKQSKEIWVLYDAEEYLQMGSELLIAQKWSAAISNQLKHQNQKLSKSRA